MEYYNVMHSLVTSINTQQILQKIYRRCRVSNKKFNNFQHNSLMKYYVNIFYFTTNFLTLGSHIFEIFLHSFANGKKNSSKIYFFKFHVLFLPLATLRK